jgi:hypothetical protein
MPQTQMDRIRFKLALLREIRRLDRSQFATHEEFQARVGYMVLGMLAEGGWN